MASAREASEEEEEEEEERETRAGALEGGRAAEEKADEGMNEDEDEDEEEEERDTRDGVLGAEYCIMLDMNEAEATDGTIELVT
jgi:hypothetical protein